MDRLSQEIIGLIVSHLQRWERPDYGDKGVAFLPPYASISRSWQYAIEIHTFREVSVKSTELEWFSRIMVDHRRQFLRRLNFDIILPTYTDMACTKFETDQERQANNQVFTQAIKDLLALLRSWHDDFESTRNDPASVEQSICLGIVSCYSSKDDAYTGWEKYRMLFKDDEFLRHHDLFEHRYEASLLQLLSVEETQEIPQISSFFRSRGRRAIEPRSLAILASKFPNLDTISWKLDDNEKRDPHSRQQTRLDFAEALQMIPRGSLKQITLDYYNNPPSNQEKNPSSALTPSLPATDHLSLGIHAISQSENLTHLVLDDNIVISPSLFWPETQTKPPSWPNLSSITVYFGMNAPNGDWYFSREDTKQVESDPDDYYDSDESRSDEEQGDGTTVKQNPDPNTPDIYVEKNVALATGDAPVREFRGKVIPEKLNPLFEAAARAAAHMPRLRCMTLQTEARASMHVRFAMKYFAPGKKTKHGAGSRNVDSHRLGWVIGTSGYEPAESVLNLWQEAKGEIVQSVAKSEFD